MVAVKRGLSFKNLLQSILDKLFLAISYTYNTHPGHSLLTFEKFASEIWARVSMNVYMNLTHALAHLATTVHYEFMFSNKDDQETEAQELRQQACNCGSKPQKNT